MEKFVKEAIVNNRKAIKEDWRDLRKFKTDRQLGKKRPIMFKEAKAGSMIVDLPKDFPNIIQKSLTECIKNRRSLRTYSEELMTLEEVAYLLWETSRVDSYKEGVTFRTIPTGGATNSMETYIYLNRVEGLEKGLYLYVQDKHQLSLLNNDNDLEKRVNEALYGQLRNANIVFFLTATPYRTEYKYAHLSHKMIAMEAGHACQNISLSSEIVDSGACAIAAYIQEYCDKLLEIGDEEFVTYAVTVGKKAIKSKLI